jgi:hypothetical protein
MGLPVLVILLLGAVLIAILTVGPRAGALESAAGAALSLLPALLMTVVIDLGHGQPLATGRRGTDTPWRVTLAALRFSLAEQTLSIGGDAQSDDLVIPGLPQNTSTTLRIAPGAKQELLIRDSVPGPRGGALLLKESSDSGEDQKNGALEFGGIPIPPGAEICLSDDGVRCRPESEHLIWERFRQGETGVLHDASGAALCPLPPPSSARALSSTAKRVFPLATYGRAGCAGSALFSWKEEGEPAGELLYWREGAPGWRDRLMFWRRPEPQLYLLPVDYNRVFLVRSGGQVTRIERKPLTVAPGEEARLSVYQIIPAATLPSADRGDDNFARLQERRSFLVRYRQAAGLPGPVLDVFLDTPQTVALTASSHPAITISAQSASPESLVGSAQIAGFSLIGKPTAAGLLSTVRLASTVAGGPSGCRTQNEPLIVQGVTGITCAQIGRWFALGDPGRVLAKLRIVPLTVPLAWVAAIWAIFLTNLLVRDALKISVPVRILLSVLEVLLVLRVLVAFEAAAVDSRREDAVAGAWLALLWLPLAFELVPASRVGPFATIAARSAKLLLAITGTVMIAHAAGVPTGSLSGWSTWFHGDMGKSALVSIGLCLPAWLLVRGPLLASNPLGLDAERSPLVLAAIPLVSLALIHFGLLLAGVKEQILGVRIAAGLIPLLVLAWAHWYATVRRVRETLDPLQELAALLAPFLTYITFVLARDIGAFIYFIALAVWLSMGSWPSKARELALWVALGCLAGSALLIAMTALGSAFRPLLVPGGALVVVAVAVVAVLAPWRQLAAVRPHLASVPALAVLGILCALQLGGDLLKRQAVAEPASHAVTWQDVSHIQSLSGNAIRLLELLAPQAVENLGVRAAYEQRVAMAEMLEYGASTAGKGWLRIPAPDALRQTHVDDNVTAVHLLGPFGRAGGLGLAILLLVFAASIYALSAGKPVGTVFRAQLAATMLVVTSLYMLLANIGQVPFTGRNFYFLAIASHSDLLEGELLLVIVLSAFTGPEAREHASEA